MTTRRERMERKLEKREEWAEGRQEKADARSKQASEKANMIPFGQPILVGHYSEGRDRRFRAGISRDFEKAHEHREMADHHRSRAEGIRAQLDTSIYSDDDDAIEQLEKRIDGLEAERARIVAFNAAVRKVKATDEVERAKAIAALMDGLDEKQKRDYLMVAKVAPYQLRNGQFPAYATSNLSGNIKRNRDRLERLRSQA